MSVKIEICGRISERGLLFDMDLRDIKGPIKEYLDNAYDHRLLLNKDDELVSPPRVYPPDTTYPGLRETDGDPTTENIALWVGQWVRQWMFAQVSFKPSGLNRIEYIRVDVQETPTNGAFWVSS
jgi:6-pyruvoyl-tetrahydropterin synthase